MAAGYHYGVKLRITPTGLSPASTAASLAALPPVGFPVWTVTGYDPLRIGTPAGTIWLSVDAVEDEWKLIKAFVQWERKDRLHHWPVHCDESLFGDGPLNPDDPWSYDLPL